MDVSPLSFHHLLTQLKVPAVWKLNITFKLVEGTVAVWSINDFHLFPSWNLVRLSTGWRGPWWVWQSKMMGTPTMSASVRLKAFLHPSMSLFLCFKVLNVYILGWSVPTPMDHCLIFKTIVIFNNIFHHLSRVVQGQQPKQGNVKLYCWFHSHFPTCYSWLI